MAVCRVIKATAGWNVGDTVEAFEHRIKELVDEGIVEVVISDEVKKAEAPVAKKTRKKKGE